MIASGPDAKRPPHILLLMTPSPNPTGMKQTPFFSRFRFMPAAFILGTMAGLAVVYGMGGFQRNAGVETACRPAADLAKKLTPLFKGEIAALTPAKTPIRPPQLSFRDSDGRDRTLADWKGPCRPSQSLGDMVRALQEGNAGARRAAEGAWRPGL